MLNTPNSTTALTHTLFATSTSSVSLTFPHSITTFFPYKSFSEAPIHLYHSRPSDNQKTKYGVTSSRMALTTGSGPTHGTIIRDKTLMKISIILFIVSMTVHFDKSISNSRKASPWLLLTFSPYVTAMVGV